MRGVTYGAGTDADTDKSSNIFAHTEPNRTARDGHVRTFDQLLGQCRQSWRGVLPRLFNFR